MASRRTWIAVASLWMVGCSGSKNDDIRGLGRGERDAAQEPDAQPEDEDSGLTDLDGGSVAQDGAVEDGAVEAGIDASTVDGSAASDTGVEDASIADTGTGQDAAPDASLARGLYVDPASGLNTNDGQQPTPFKTIAHAASIATAGDTIWLLPGTYDPSTEPRFMGTDAAPCGALSGITIPTGVTVRAVSAGQAILRVNAPHGFCVTGGALIGLTLGFINTGGTLISASAGEVLIEGTQISRAGTGGSGNEFGIHAQGTAHVIIRPGALTNLVGSPNYKYAVARDQGVLEVQGATLRGNSGDIGSGNAVFLARDQGELILDNVRLEEFTNQNAVVTHGTGKVTLRNGTQIVGTGPGAGQGGVRMGGTSTLVLQNATLRNLGTAIVSEIYVANNPTLSASDTILENNVNGIYFGGDTSPLVANVSFTGGHIRGNSSHGVYSNIPGTYTFDGASVTGNGGYGINLSNPANLVSLKLRRSQVSTNVSSAVFLTGASGSTLDLGTLSDPGANTLVGNNTSNQPADSSVRASLSGVVIQAVGNTWNASVQGADSDGRYTVVGAGAVLDVTSASGNGRNYNLGANTSLRLAANP